MLIKSMNMHERNLILDFVKGVLVIIMVIYHVMNIFTNTGWETYSYIRFVSGSFLFISGYILSVYYEQKIHLNKSSTTRRLVIRGVKLLLVFSLLNMVIQFSGIGNPNKIHVGIKKFILNGYDIYGIGKPGIASFQILLPIAYIIILSPLLLLLSKFRNIMMCFGLTIAFCISFFEIDSINLGLGSLGIIGLYGGMFVNRWQSTYTLKSRALIFIFLIFCFVLMKYMDRNLISYALGVALVIKLFYDLGATLNLKSQINYYPILLGQYSLICYIGQIIFLQVFFIFYIRQKWELGYEPIIVMIITILFLVVMCQLLSFLRYRSKIIDNAYRFVFS